MDRSKIDGVSESEPTQTTKEAWWAGYRAGKGLPPDTSRPDALAALPQAASEPTDAPYSHISPTSAFTVQATYEHTGKMKPRQFPDDEPTDALDAARYRWLRGRCDDCAVELSFSPSVERGWITVQQGNEQGPALDAAIDAAMAKRAAEGGSNG